MRLAYVVVVTVVALFAGNQVASAAADPNQSKLSALNTPDDVLHVAGVLSADVEAGNTRRFLRVETEINSAGDEERALPGMSKISEKLKPIADKLKPVTNKLTPAAEKITDSAMAVAVRLKPIADTFSGKLKPIADKLMPILKPLGAKLNSYAVVKRITTKLKEYVQKVKNYKIGKATVKERYTMAKFEYWFKQNKSPDDVKEMLKLGTGATVNTKNHDLWAQYKAFYSWVQGDKEMKAAKAA
ncbi:hypothetical protein ON010_g2990 [Phytophthora cinnamomi]|nr:hypothetical protein ON010_g2990 [Phytophthora cinnamomi]